MCKQDGIFAIIQAIKTFKDNRDIVKTAGETLSKIATQSGKLYVQSQRNIAHN